MSDTNDKVETFATENGALTEVPVWERHKRGRNWAAVIAKDPRAPGGLARAFLPRAHGEYFYMVEGLRPGVAVEFGADYYTTSGRKQSDRWYGAVVEVRADAVVVEPASSGRAAVERAAGIRAAAAAATAASDGASADEARPAADPAEALAAEIAALVAARTESLGLDGEAGRALARRALGLAATLAGAD